VRSKIRWFTEFCNSHYLSHFAAFFIDARAKRSVVESFDLFKIPLRIRFDTKNTVEFWVLWRAPRPEGLGVIRRSNMVCSQGFGS
jgi:hypothetical protein